MLENKENLINEIKKIVYQSDSIKYHYELSENGLPFQRTDLQQLLSYIECRLDINQDDSLPNRNFATIVIKNANTGEMIKGWQLTYWTGNK